MWLTGTLDYTCTDVDVSTSPLLHLAIPASSWTSADWRCRSEGRDSDKQNPSALVWIWSQTHGIRCRRLESVGRSTQTTLFLCWSSWSSSMSRSYWLTSHCWWRTLSFPVIRWCWPPVALTSGEDTLMWSGRFPHIHVKHMMTEPGRLVWDNNVHSAE